MAGLRPLLCVLLALSSRVLGGLGSRHANLPPDCEYSSTVHIPKGTTKTFFVHIPHRYFSLKIVLNQLSCLDKKESEQKDMMIKDFLASKWSEVQLSVDEQGYRVRVDGREKLTAEKNASCFKVTGVDVNGYGHVLSVDCDPRLEENTSTSPVTTNETSIVSTTYTTETNTPSKTTEEIPQEIVLGISIGSTIFLTVFIVISVGCLKKSVDKKKAAFLKTDVAQPTVEVNSQTAVNRSNDIRLAEQQSSMGLNAPPPLPPAFSLQHAQSMNLATAQLNDTFPSQGNLLFHTLPQRREFMGGSGNHEHTSSEHLYEEVNENSIFSPLGAGGNQALADSHESINSFYAAF